MKKLNRREQGFSLIELVVVVAVMFIIAAFAIFQGMGSMVNYKANAAQDVVFSQLRVARGLAISQRRTVQVWIDQSFSGPGGTQQVKYQVQAAAQTAEVPGPIVAVPLPAPVQFMLEPGVPDTPMAFGNAAAVFIGNTSGGPAIMQFNPTGTFTDNTGTAILNGTIFLGMTGQVSTARAVTIMGGTGRVRQYTWNGTSIGWRE
jgi:prepilin-type N-terminal cleavage/methylation domain-containing protein